MPCYPPACPWKLYPHVAHTQFCMEVWLSPVPMLGTTFPSQVRDSPETPVHSSRRWGGPRGVRQTLHSQPPSCRHSRSTSALKRTPETQTKVTSTLGGQPAPREKGCSSLPGTPTEIGSGCPASLLPSRFPASEWELTCGGLLRPQPLALQDRRSGVGTRGERGVQESADPLSLPSGRPDFSAKKACVMPTAVHCSV